MELKVHVDQTIRLVCGVNEQTTVQEIIMVLAQALKQTGRFYLVECWSGNNVRGNRLPMSLDLSKNRARVLSASERPLQSLKSYFNLSGITHMNDDVEFHLVRTSITQPNQLPLSPLHMGNVNSLLLNINRQKYLISEQAIRLNDLVDSIRLQEAIKQKKLDEEYIKRRLFHLELKSKLNDRKLKKVASSSEQTSVETEFRREVELNEFLRAQIDYYRRKLETTRLKSESIENEHKQMRADYEILSSSVCEANFVEIYKQTMNQFEVNVSKLKSLDSSIASLDETISAKTEVINKLENELDCILGNNKQATTTESSFASVWVSDSSSEEVEISGSTESILNDLGSAQNKSSSEEMCDNNTPKLGDDSSSSSALLVNRFSPEDIYFF